MAKLSIKQGDFKWVSFFKYFIKGNYAHSKCLIPEYVNYNTDFLKGILAGLIDSDGSISLNKTLMFKLASESLIQQLKQFLVSQNMFPAGSHPWRQNLNFENYKDKLSKPIYCLELNMNQNKDFFLNLNSLKIKSLFTCFDYKPEMANGVFEASAFGNTIKDNIETYEEDIVFDLSTESHHFYCNNILVHNCYAYDLELLVTKGLFFIKGFNALPPQHLLSYVDFVAEFISYCCNRSSGAVGLPSFLIYCYYFWKKDIDNNYLGLKWEDKKSIEKYREQAFQSIIYKLNQPFLRSGIQSAFTNFSIFDESYFESLFGGKTFPDGSFMIDIEDDFMEFQKAFMETCSEIRSINMMTFPVLTISLLKDKNTGKFINEDFAKWACKHNMKWGDSNFFISSDVTSLSNCCRLKSNIQDLGYFNSIGGTALEVGSIKVNTINLAKIAYETNNKEEYLKKLKEKIILNLKSLDIVRAIIKRNIDKGLLLNYTYGLMHLENQYNTIGIIGIYEALQKFNLTEKDILGNTSYTEEGINFAKDILNTIHEVKEMFKKEFNCDYMINIEQIPGERAAAILMEKDKKLFPNEAYELPLYGNQWIPLGVKCTLDEKIKLSAILDEACNGGSIAHINLEAPLTDFDTAWKLLNYISNAGVTYFAFNLRISACEENHGFFGETCPICGKPKVTTYQRIVGFLTPERTYSKERKDEFKRRSWMNVNSSSLLS